MKIKITEIEATSEDLKMSFIPSYSNDETEDDNEEEAT